MLRGWGLLGLASRVAGTKGFSTEIFVSRLSFYTTEQELKNMFSWFGPVEEAQLVRDNQTGRPKGFGFVKYSSQSAAEKAVKAMDGMIIRSRLIFVELVKEGSTEWDRLWRLLEYIMFLGLKAQLSLYLVLKSKMD